MTDVHPIDCDAFGDKLPLFVGGDLDAGVLASCDEHLTRCAPCRGALDRAHRARQTYFEVSHASVARDLEDLQLDLWPAVRDGLRRDGVLQGAGDAQPLALGLPATADHGTPAPAVNCSRLALLRGGVLAAAAALLAVAVWPSGAGNSEDRSGGDATPAVAVSDEGSLPANTEGAPSSPALSTASSTGFSIDPGIVAQPGTLAQPGGVQPGGLQPVTEFGNSLLYETLMSELLKDGPQPMDRFNTDQLASQIGLPLR